MIKDRDGNKRMLRADEIECRVGQQTKDKSKYTVLLYKTARVDADILDEVFGSNNWKSTHYEVKGKDFCMIEVRLRFEDDSALMNNGKSIGYEWVGKSDCGSESNIEAQKGEASDAFKRAGFQWGIGRELYTAPKIWLSSDVDPYSLSVSKIGYDENGTLHSVLHQCVIGLAPQVKDSHVLIELICPHSSVQISFGSCPYFVFIYYTFF